MSAGTARTVMAFDYGLRRIGVAVGNTLTGTARPLATLAAKNGRPDWREITQVCSEYSPTLCLVGIPYNMDESEGPLSRRARAFAAELAVRVPAEVVLLDERLSSREAGDLLRGERASGSRSRRLRPGDVDQMAAVLLLMQWLRQPAGKPM